MTTHREPRRVLIAAAGGEGIVLRALFQSDPLAHWEVLAADTYEQARFILQHDACDALLIDQSICQKENDESLDWLTRLQGAPIVFLADPSPQSMMVALQHGVSQWLPAELTRANPSLLAAALNQCAQVSDLGRHARQMGESLQDCRRQISRLVKLLWESSPVDPSAQWLSQRGVMGLHEEVVRAERYGSPLSVVIGEPASSVEERIADGPHPVPRSAHRLAESKRRSDVVGQYGPRGFILLLPSTSEAGAEQCCRRLRPLLETAGHAADEPWHFGTASYSTGLATSKSLLRRAEEVLDKARAAGDDLLGN